MIGDLVVVVPGIMGSGLADRDGHDVWGSSAGSVIGALRTRGGSLRALQLPADVGDGPAPDGVLPTKLLPSFHAIPGIWTPLRGYSEQLTFLGARRFGLTIDQPSDPPGNLVVFPYDWRLSNRYTAQRLKERVESALARWRASASERADAKVVFICHSMGGLIVRWYLDRLGGAEIARVLVTIGTPHRGAAKALDQLVNGVRKGAGPLKVDLTDFGRSLPSSYQLLPEYACIDSGAAELKKTTEIELPFLDKALVADGMGFHNQLDRAPKPTYSIVPIVGIRQPTTTSFELTDDRAVPRTIFHGKDQGGDGTVPRLSARPKAMSETDAVIHGVGVGDGHVALAGNRAVTDQLDFLLTAQDVIYRLIPPPEDDIIGVCVEDLHEYGEDVAVAIDFPEKRALQAVALDEADAEVSRAPVRYGAQTDSSGRALGKATLQKLEPGGYTIVVRAPDDPDGGEVVPVHAATVVLK